MNDQEVYKISSLNIRVPADEKRFLTDFLNPTAEGSNYWDSPQEAQISGLSEREISRIIRQATEIKEIIDYYDINKSEDIYTFLDVGTGNGMVPRFLTFLEPKVEAVGIDPFLHGGHKTSWQNCDLSEELDSCWKFWTESSKNKNANKPNISKNDCLKRYSEYKKYLDKYLEDTKLKFDCVYCKAIEHVPNWRLFANQLANSLNNNGTLIIKHRSFFSYLGPHRYSTTIIPWGHCMLKDYEYKEYVDRYHKERSEEMNSFYFSSLSYPRMSISDLILTMINYGIYIDKIIIDRPRYQIMQNKVIESFPWLPGIILKNNPNLSFEEITSGLITFIFKKKG